MRIITLLITLFAFGITPLQAFSYFSFKKYQVEDGLSHNTVRGAAGGAVLCAETLKAKGYIQPK